MKRSTWIILLVFLIGVGILLYLKYRPTPTVTEETGTPTATTAPTWYLFNSEDSSALTSIRIYDKQYHIVLLERPAGGLWIVSLPTPYPASQAEAEAGATQVTALVIKDTIAPSVPTDILGLDFPVYTMKLSFQTIGQHKLEIGNKTPTGTGYYIRYDDGPIYIIDADGIDSILNLLTSPPYLPTETPIPNPESATPTP
jgi:hypothetical protein